MLKSRVQALTQSKKALTNEWLYQGSGLGADIYSFSGLQFGMENIPAGNTH